MANKRFYWLKLKEDFFSEKYIKALRRLPQGDSLVIIYLKMQLKSLKTEGIINYEGILPNSIAELAMAIDEDENVVRLAVEALINFGAIERWENDTLYMAAMQELVGSETAVAERVRKHRALHCNAKTLPCNINVTKCNTEIEKEKEIEKEIEKKKIKKEKKQTLDSLIDSYTENENLRYELKEHLKTRKTKKAAMTNRAIELSLKRLDGISSSDKEKIEIVQNAVMNGWTAFYPLKKDEQPVNQPTAKYKYAGCKIGIDL